MLSIFFFFFFFVFYFWALLVLRFSFDSLVRFDLFFSNKNIEYEFSKQK